MIAIINKNNIKLHYDDFYRQNNIGHYSLLQQIMKMEMNEITNILENFKEQKDKLKKHQKEDPNPIDFMKMSLKDFENVKIRFSRRK